jgi:hypothetical protein
MIQILVVGCLLMVAVSGRGLVMLQETFRHGALYPTYLEEATAFGLTFTPDAPRELTSQGRSMHYILGRLIYEKYWDELFEGASHLNASEILVKSTYLNRTIESAQCHLLGLL